MLKRKNCYGEGETYYGEEKNCYGERKHCDDDSLEDKTKMCKKEFKLDRRGRLDEVVIDEYIESLRSVTNSLCRKSLRDSYWKRDEEEIKSRPHDRKFDDIVLLCKKMFRIIESGEVKTRVLSMNEEYKDVKETSYADKCVKFVALQIFTCAGCSGVYLNDVLAMAVLFGCSEEMMQWLLDQGSTSDIESYKTGVRVSIETLLNTLLVDSIYANPLNSLEEVKYFLSKGAKPNGMIGIEFNRLTVLANAVIIINMKVINPEIFYWLVVYGGELYLDHEHCCSNIVDILECDKSGEAKDVGIFWGKSKNLSGEIRDNKLRAAAEVRRGVKRMKEEVKLYCPLLPPLLDIVSIYLYHLKGVKQSSK